jgi:hypothetical protein
VALDFPPEARLKEDGVDQEFPMRPIALLLGLAATLASAQQPVAVSSQQDPLPPPPLMSSPQAADEPEWDTPPSLAPPAEPEPRGAPPTPAARPTEREPEPASPPPRKPAPKRPLRYSRLSADSGGPTLVLTEAVGGMVLGAMLGSTYDDANGRSDNAYAGAMLGALTLGTASTLYQYFVPVKRNESLLAASASTLGFMAGVSAANAWDLDSRQRALLALTTSQVGVASVLLVTAGGEDVSSGDAGLVGMTAFYAFIATGLVEYIGSRQSGERFRYTPLLVAPAAGMLVGGLLAMPLEIPPSSIRDVTLFPAGMGLVALLVGSRLDVSNVTVAKTVLGTVAGSFAITVLLSALSPDEPTQQDERADSAFQPIPVPVVVPAGRGNDALAAGPGLFMRF